MNFISLYSGAGGLDLGIEAAGFKSRLAVEFDQEAVRTIRHNRDWTVLDKDILSPEASSTKILKTASLSEGEVELLVGGPPCQPFSKSGFWHSGSSKRLNDPRSLTLNEYFRVLEDTLPAAFLLENVPGIKFSERSEGFAFIQSELNRINKKKSVSYSFSAAQLNAAEYGVPQNRERVFVVGCRNGRIFKFPNPTHNIQESNNHSGNLFNPRNLKAALTAWDAIGHLEDNNDETLRPTGKWAELLESIPEGSNYLFHTSRGGGIPLFGWRSRYWSMLLKLAKNKPSWTLTAQPGPAIGPFHWKNRRLSPQELCALQTFPSDYEIVGNLRSIYKQVGNAVPSAIAEILANEIKKQFFNVEVPAIESSLIPKKSLYTPPPEVIKKVTASQYLELAGNYEDHPGTGKGPGALKRLNSI